MRACGVLAPLTLVSRPEVAQLERDVAKESPRPFFFLSVEDSSWRPRWQQLAGGGRAALDSWATSSRWRRRMPLAR